MAKKIIITGASTGIGAETSRMLAKVRRKLLPRISKKREERPTCFRLTFQNPMNANALSLNAPNCSPLWMSWSTMPAVLFGASR